MKKSVLTVLIALLPLAAIAQPPSINEDGKKMEKEKMETKDYLPEVHGTIRAKSNIRPPWVQDVSKYAMPASA